MGALAHVTDSKGKVRIPKIFLLNPSLKQINELDPDLKWEHLVFPSDQSTEFLVQELSHRGIIMQL